MPSVAKAHDAPATIAAPQHPAIRADQDQLTSIKAIVDRMHTYTSDDPYILTIPQDESRYQHHYHYQTVQWLDCAPFEINEREKIQYQTFHFREQGKDMFVLENSWSGAYDEPRKESQEQKLATSANGGGTPSVKKISLNAYKKKLAGSTPLGANAQKDETPSKQPAVKGPVERLKAESDQVLASVTKPDIGDSVDLVSSVKRKRDEQVETMAGDSPSRDAVEDRSAKRQMQGKKEDANEISAVKKRDTSKRASSVGSDDLNSMPPRLLPPRLSPLHNDALPPRLSPTMPDNIEASLKARVQRKAMASLSEPKTDRKLKSPPSQLANGHSSAVRHGSPTRTESGTRNRKLDTDPANDDGLSDEISVSRLKRKRDPSPSSLVVKLKVKDMPGRAVKDIPGAQSAAAKRENIASKPKETGVSKADAATKPKSRDAAGKGVAQKIGPVGESSTKSQKEKNVTAEKRTLPTDESFSSEPVAKRSKISDGLRTPILPHAASPSVGSGPGKLSQQATPNLRKDQLSTAMKRELSTDSISNTPSGRPTSTPIPRSSQAGQSSIKTPAQMSWETMQKHFEVLGRELKHAATDLLRTPGKDSKDTGPSTPSSSDQKLAAVKCVESVLSYVLAFACADQAANAAEPRLNPSLSLWRSLVGFLSHTRRTCEKIPLLSGIACLLGVVIYARMLEISSQNSNSSSPREISKFYLALQRESSDAEMSLDIDTLIKSLPRTWAARTSKESTSALTTPKQPGRFEGPYKLPIGLQTPPIVAARACHAMLQEWLEKANGLEYQLKLKLKVELT